MKPLSLVLALTVLLGTPGLPAYQAAAAVVRPVAVARWNAVSGDLLFRSASAPQPLLSPRLENILGQARLVVGTAPRSPEAAAALSFVSHLPAAFTANPDFVAAQPVEWQAAALEHAVGAASAELEARAAAFLARGEDAPLSSDDHVELAALAAAWFYLSPEASAPIRARAAAERSRRTLDLGAAIARALGKASADPEKTASDRAAAVEVDFILADVARLSESRGAIGATRTRDVLAPFVARSLDRAAALQAERGHSGASVYERVLAGHRSVFGGKVAKPALRALRPAGEWTPLIAAASLHAAERLAATDADSKFLKDAAADWDLRLAIPSWRPEAGAAPSVAELLTARHGATAPEFPMKGRLFTAFGIPVRADMGFYLFAAFMAFQLSTNFFAKASNPLLLGFAAVALLYVTLLGHEFGHALVARAFGVKTHGIALNFLGGAAYIEREPRRPLADFLIAFAGPAVNFLVAAALYPVLGMLDPGGLRAVLTFTLFGNVLLGAMNLLPAYPMDGGRILRAGLAALLGDHYKATHITARIGMVLGMAAAILGTAQVSMLGDWSALFTIMIGVFIVMVSRAALYHPGTDIVEPSPKK